MLAIGRGLMLDPAMLMFDEPSLGLAPIIVEEIFGLLMRIRDMGKTILLIEQNANMALQIADRGYVIETGRVALRSGVGTQEQSEGGKRLPRYLNTMTFSGAVVPIFACFAPHGADSKHRKGGQTVFGSAPTQGESPNGYREQTEQNRRGD